MKVRGDLLRTYQTLHTWTGITTALVLFIAFYAGALTLFKPAINQWATPPSQQLSPIKANQMDLLVEKTLAEHQGAKHGFTLNLSEHHSPITWHEVNMGREINLNLPLWHGTLDSNQQLLTHQVQPSALAQLIDLLHQTAGIPGDIGHEKIGVLILGVASVLYFLAIVSGIVILLPTMTKTLFALKDKKPNKSRFTLNSHNLLGITSLPFHLIMCLTAIVFAFHDPFYDSLQQVVYGDNAMFARPAIKANAQNSNLIMPQQLLRQATAHAPNHIVTEIAYVNLQTPRPMARIALYDNNSVMRGPITDYAFIHPYSGDIINSSIDQAPDNRWMRIVSTFFALHFGSYGGDFTRWVYFLLGISGAMIFYTGNLLWLEKRAKKTTTCDYLHKATVGVCLGSISALCITMLTSKWLYLQVDNINYWSMGIYYSLFATFIALTCYQGAKQATISLTSISAITCAAIPLTSILAPLTPWVWASDTTTTIAVDLIALLCAIGFYLIARASNHQHTPHTSAVSLKVN